MQRKGERGGGVEAHLLGREIAIPIYSQHYCETKCNSDTKNFHKVIAYYLLVRESSFTMNCNLVSGKDVKKPNKKTSRQTSQFLIIYKEPLT